jgi:superoxide dismutase, Fe-Mn family
MISQNHMTKFEEKKFEIPKLKGISEKNIEEHLKLYAGYVKHANLIQNMIEQYGEVLDEGGKYSVAEVTRRFSFEFNGMRNHEYYFSCFEGGPKDLEEGSELKKEIEKEFGSFDKWLTRFKTIALTRGVGWAMLYFDPHTKQLLNQWVDEHHLGQLSSCSPVLALDMWEHAFVADYQPSGKKNYIEDFFSNLNWEVIENNFKEARG